MATDLSSQPDHPSSVADLTFDNLLDDQETQTQKSDMPSTAPRSVSQAAPKDDDHESMAAALFVATAMLQQALDFVQHSITEESQLVYESMYLPGSTIGECGSTLV